MPQLRQYAEKYGAKGLTIVAINVDRDPSRVRQFLIEKQVQIPVLLRGDAVQRNFGIDGPHHTFLIDGSGVVRAHQHGALNDKSFDQKIELLLGMTPPEFGWLRSVAATYQKAIEDADAGRLDPALNALKSIAPPRTMFIKVETSSLPPQYVRTCLQAASAGVQQWQKILGKFIQFQFVSDEDANAAHRTKPEDNDRKKDEKKEDAEAAHRTKPEDKRPDLIIKFATQVYDPADNAGITTVCAHTRVMNEGEMGMRPNAGEERKPRHTVALIAVGHASAGTHSPRALVHLVQMSVAYALGLDHRDDADSITKVNVDDDSPTIAPSAEDLLALSNLLTNVHVQMGNVYLKQKKFKEAADEFQYALAVNPRDTRAAEGLKQAQQQKVVAGTNGKS